MRKTARSPEPKAAEEIKFNGKENDQKSDVKPNYNKSVTFRKMQMQRNRNKQISSKVSVGKGSNEGKDTGMFNFLGLNDLGSPRRNLAQEIDEAANFRSDIEKLTKEQVIERIERMNEEHKKIVAQLKTKIENDLAIAQAINK